MPAKVNNLEIEVAKGYSVQRFVGHPSQTPNNQCNKIAKIFRKIIDILTITAYRMGMKTKQQKMVQGKVEILRETEKAFQVDFGSGMGGMMWLPKSQITIADGIVTMPAWLMRAKLVDNQRAYNNLTSDQKAQGLGYRSAEHFMQTQTH